MKRARSYAPSYARKRAKMVRRYRKRRPARARKSSFMSSQKGGALSTYMARRRPALSGRAYRSLLWKSTQQKEHYRSILSQQTVLTTTTSSTTKTGALITMYDEAFYTGAGGSQSLDTFVGDIVIRGGLATLGIMHNAEVTIKVEVYKLYMKDNLPTIPSPVPVAWDPSNLNDFEQYYTIGERKSFDIEPGDTVTLMHRLRVSKIDQSISASLQRMPYWLVFVNNPSNSAQSIGFVYSHNMSFSADAVA